MSLPLEIKRRPLYNEGRDIYPRAKCSNYKFAPKYAPLQVDGIMEITITICRVFQWGNVENVRISGLVAKKFFVEQELQLSVLRILPTIGRLSTVSIRVTSLGHAKNVMHKCIQIPQSQSAHSYLHETIT